MIVLVGTRKKKKIGETHRYKHGKREGKAKIG
jgi:hypothetical protein